MRHAWTMSIVPSSTTVRVPRLFATNAYRPLFEYAAQPGVCDAAESKPPDGMRHARSSDQNPGICGIGVRFRPRPSANVIGPSSLGHTSASESLVGQNCALCNCESKVARKDMSDSATSQTTTLPSAAVLRSFLPSEDHATENTAGSCSTVPSSFVMASGTSSLATLLVTKSKMAMLPPLVPAARRVPLRLNATQVALPCCRASSIISSMSLPGTPSVGIRGGGSRTGKVSELSTRSGS